MSHCNDIDVIVLFTSGPHLRHNYHGNKTLETMLSGSVEFVGHRLNRPVLLHLCVCRVLPINNATHTTPCLACRTGVIFLRPIGERRQALGEREGRAQKNKYFPHFHRSYQIDQ